MVYGMTKHGGGACSPAKPQHSPRKHHGSLQCAVCGMASARRGSALHPAVAQCNNRHTFPPLAHVTLSSSTWYEASARRAWGLASTACGRRGGWVAGRGEMASRTDEWQGAEWGSTES